MSPSSSCDGAAEPLREASLGSALVQRARHPKALLTDPCTDAGKMGVPLVSGVGHGLQGCAERGATRAWLLFLGAKALGQSLGHPGALSACNMGLRVPARQGLEGSEGQGWRRRGG